MPWPRLTELSSSPSVLRHFENFKVDDPARYRKYWRQRMPTPPNRNIWNDPTTRGRGHAALVHVGAIRGMKLTDDVFRSFRVAKVFRENTDRVNCIDFSANGEHMISSSNDDSIVVYCCQEGRCALKRTKICVCVPPPPGIKPQVFCMYHRPKRTLYSKKYGCDLLQYTHAPNTIIYSSNKVDGQWTVVRWNHET